jgi:hypothetical protein
MQIFTGRRFANSSLLSFIPILGLLGLCLWAGNEIFKHSVFSTHDGIHHIARGYDAVTTVREGHFPLRWAGSLNYWCGVPIFNFFYPLLYYLIAILSFAGIGVITSINLISFFSLPIGTLGFYLWMNLAVKQKWPSFIAAVLYLMAPYRFSLIFVRGCPEYLTYAILPWVLYFFHQAVKSPRFQTKIEWLFLTALSGDCRVHCNNRIP